MLFRSVRPPRRRSSFGHRAAEVRSATAPPKFVRPPRRRSSFGHRAHTEHACRRAAMPSAQFSDAARVRCRGCRTRRHLACTSHRWFLGVWGECRPSRVGKFVHKIVNGFVSAKPFLRSTRVLQCKPPTRCRRSFRQFASNGTHVPKSREFFIAMRRKVCPSRR